MSKTINIDLTAPEARAVIYSSWKVVVNRWGSQANKHNTALTESLLALAETDPINSIAFTLAEYDVICNACMVVDYHRAKTEAEDILEADHRWQAFEELGTAVDRLRASVVR